MHVIYRMCGIQSSNPSPVFWEDKQSLNSLCLDSFFEEFKEVRPYTIFLMDHCKDEDFVSVQKCPFPYEMRRSTLGINETMLESYRIASELPNDEEVLFQECDYVYRPGVAETFRDALHEFDIVSPYDHKNFYMAPDIHSDVCQIRLFQGTHFRTVERDTMTWGCLARVVKECLPILNMYGYLDSDVWHMLRELRGKKLWVPIPSFATHMAKDWLAPSVEWEKLW